MFYIYHHKLFAKKSNFAENFAKNPKNKIKLIKGKINEKYKKVEKYKKKEKTGKYKKLKNIKKGKNWKI